METAFKKAVAGTDIISGSPEETMKLAEEFASNLSAGDSVALVGELGAGKTIFAKGLSKGLGFRGDVTSPSFALINEYAAKMAVYHFDFYRLNAIQELRAIGFEDYLASGGICIFEWADKFEEILPSDSIWVYLSHVDGNEGERRIKIDHKGGMKH